MSRAAYINGLTAEENERLAILSEECAEVIQIIGKIHRHGFESRDPTTAGSLINRRLLENELGDIDAAVALMAYKDDIVAKNMMRASRSKLHRLVRWLRLPANLKAVNALFGGEQ